MKDSKLISIFKTLSDEELILLNKFVNSKLFNQNKQVVELFDLIRVKLRYKTFKLEKMVAFKQLFRMKLMMTKK